MRIPFNAPFNLYGSDADGSEGVEFLHDLYGFLTKPSRFTPVTPTDTAFFRVIRLVQPGEGFRRVWSLN